MNTSYRHTQKEHGFTLIELLLYVALVALLLGGLMGFIGLVGASQVKNKTISEVTEQGIFAMDNITKTIRTADSVTQPAPGASSATLTLVVPVGASSPTIYSLNGSTLQVTEGASAAVALTSSKVRVTNLTFKNLTQAGSQPIIQVSYTIDNSSTAGLQEYSFQKTFTSSAEVGW